MLSRTRARARSDDDALTVLGVGQADGRGILDVFGVAHDALDLGGRHVGAAADDHARQAPEHAHEAVGSQLDEVTGAVPAVGGERGARRLGIAEVAAEERRPADERLAGAGPVDPRLGRVVPEAQLGAGRDAPRESRGRFRIADGIVRDDREALGRGVDVVHRDAGTRAPLVEHELVAGLATRDAEADAVAVDGCPGAEPFDHLGEDRGHAGHERDLVVADRGQ
ncbi:hypothetical protein GCM10009749_29980 [Agromyces neolithicus]|uniref:Uncharacterized protein n=1 Tax=Agromyces neolithicus TaxID=269420 RepID=A0ABP4YHX8_9MICO